MRKVIYFLVELVGPYRFPEYT